MSAQKIFAASSLLFSLAANADDANTQKALQKAQFMLRQAASEKTDLQTQVDSLKQQVEKLTRELSENKTLADAGKQKMAATYDNAIEQWKQRDTQKGDELGSLKQQLNQQAAQRKDLEMKLQAQTTNFSACYENNKKLYDINSDLLTRYESKGFGDVLKQKEPFTGVKQVEIENLVQDYRYRIDDLKIPDGQPAPNGKSGG